MENFILKRIIVYMITVYKKFVVKFRWNFIRDEGIGIEIRYDAKPYNLLKGDRLVSYHVCVNNSSALTDRT